MALNQKRHPMIVLLSGCTLPPDINGEHIRVTRRKKLEDNPLGMFRHIADFKSQAFGEDNHGSFAQGKIIMSKKTLQKHLNNLHEKVGDAGIGSGLFHKG